MKAIVTQERVSEAAEQLRAAGEEPSIINVQARIGGGSYTTIKRYLDAWYTACQAAQQHIELPDSLAERALTLAQALWQEASDRAGQGTAQARAEAQSQVEQARAALNQAEAAIARLEVENEAQAQQLSEQQQRIAQLTEDLTQVRSLAQVAEARADEQVHHVADLQRQLAQLAEENREARSAAIEQARLEGELRALKAQLQERDALVERLMSKPAARRAASAE